MVPCPAPQHGDRPPVPRPRYAAAVTDPAATDLNDRATDPFSVADAAAAVIRERTGADRHDVALILGSGWRDSADLIGETLATIDNTDVPGFGRAAVTGHSGVMRSVSIGDTGRRALVYGTRTHYYEGEGVRPVVHGIRTAAAAGCTTVVITNGCGGLRPEWTPGTPVLISDHINLTATSPIEGPTFVDLTEVYSTRLRTIAKDVDPTLDEGVYVQFRGPHYETPAEVRMAKLIGGDLVGMSTSLEAIAARQSGLEVLGISLVTNAAAGYSETPLHHDEVLEAGRAAAERCGRLLADVVSRI
ncbi:MAG: purine-nucleoside phosphorylase [Ornithinibacter sp.]|nr:purine-nucleoside phosphorylase [Ornithinibacter sp.]